MDSAENKKVLIITYYWPPGSNPGVYRWLKFIKFLQATPWHPLVLTVNNGSYPSTDPSLEQEVPASLKVFKTKTLEPFTWYNLLRGKKGKSVEVGMGGAKKNPSFFHRTANYIRSNYFIPDARKGWKPFALKEALKQIQQHQISLIITTGPPQSTHLVGLAIKERLPHINWVADFRDPWSKVYYNESLMRTSWAQRKDEALENKVLAKADQIIVVTPGMKEEFEDRRSDIKVLYNGFDGTDIPPEKTEKLPYFTLSYLGNFSNKQFIPTFWEALRRFVDVVQPGEQFKLWLTGNIHPDILRASREYGLEDYILTSPFVPHKAATERMKNSDMLLLILPYTAQSHRILTAKIFEYLATYNPILAIGPPNGDAAQVLQQCKRDPMIDYNDMEGIVSQITAAFKAWQAGQAKQFNGKEHLFFTRQHQTTLLAELLDELY